MTAVLQLTAIDELIDVLRSVLPATRGPYELHEPELTEDDVAGVAAVIREGFVSSVGRQVGMFEAALAQRCGAAHCIAIVNGTAALHGVLHGLGIGPGDEVICPSLTFVATANAISHAGATAHFADCDPATLGLDPEALRRHLRGIATDVDGVLRNRRTGRRIAAVVPVHVFGHPCDIGAIGEVAAAFDLPVVEDATESIGSLDADGPLGARGRAGVLSFNGNKIITTGGGGAILTNDPQLAARLRHVLTTAKRPHAWRFDHDAVGYNYRMPNLNAALGMAQLARLDRMVAQKRRLAERYHRAFTGARRWKSLREPAGAASNYWLNAVLHQSCDNALLDEALARLAAEGLKCRPCWTPMHRLPMYRENPRMDLGQTEDLVGRILCLPSSAKLAALGDD